MASTSIVSDSESGNAVEIDLQTRINEITIGFNDVYLSDFFSEEYLPSASAVKRSSKLDFNTAIPPSFLPRIPITLGFKRNQYENGGELFEITNQLSMSAHGFAMTNNLTHQQLTDQQATANGNFQLSTNVDQVRLRSTIGYALKPNSELTNLALTLDPGQYKDYRLSFGINHSLQQDVTEYSATANKLLGKYSLSFGARYNTNNEINLDVRFSVGFGYEPRRKSWKQDSRTLANHGSVSARFFLDANQDGIFDEGDEPLEDISVRLNGGFNKERSDEEGILFVTGIPAHNPTNVVIAPETLIDPLWTAALEGVQIEPRPGHAIQIDFPIFTSGEIDGTVYLSKDGRENGVGRVTVELVDQNNRVISTTETAYDGFYILSNAPLGDYLVRISAAQLGILGLQSQNEESITIKGDNPYINGIDFTLEAIKPN
ncbi:MAG: carboxypeptidase regulatory-like domain-containing protein [Gammaproteobacteria bacterium]|nr:carboxypeptidase regulatory-like domain-containing protein [Gammaproteobacteria bacterium]